MTRERLSGTEPPHELKEGRGSDTEVRFTFVRHSQKISGRIYTEDGSGRIESDISGGGKLRAARYGEANLRDRKVTKAYATDLDRTRQTLESAFGAAGINPIILQKSSDIRAFFALPCTSTSPEFRKRQEHIMCPEREKYLVEHFPGKKFDELDSDGQEEVAEYAEEPAFERYLQFDNQRPDAETPSPREMAASVAFKINRLINLPDFMPSGRSIDLVSAGHKTSTEAFLKYVISREVEGGRVVGFESLSDIGGSLKILDSWDLHVKNDHGGKKTVEFILRRENGDKASYELDMDVIKTLVKEYLEQNNLKPIKIDLV